VLRLKCYKYELYLLINFKCVYPDDGSADPKYVMWFW